ncbi:regulatory protein [Mycolicibacterium phlei]|uniref:PucR family transcriptional regulator n=1 Tax=Mycolicibacterium phlei DSM 43239 = CCUG 21000 TaxID=1226750 RepID=A0A5N5VGH9_MYCPH|nr:carbohydrate diacid transcriptional activator CdaR [Mycolicibacterium phlei]KAB7759917.1 PucR family transcriptional regulator [Mycolicibacterium phlei DSM 43239 = CCUG 21000]KXW64284.1 PucR family transcriptional regulator [Mycolicibacterium phlei DSM 43072]KXW74610.1 PucR family transcriptional regulator [Mycolicibacterium phlei DSM 43070]KXW79274.1 PucR family transcriptional regulator [Mycolicibacterium phlei DSM 43071]VEG11314.1 regulatory protein [Mycobacteroides chelonae]
MTQPPERADSATLRSLMAAPHLQLFTPPEPVGDLDRPVQWVHTTELLDPSRYLHGGELVCTVGLSLHSPEDCAAFAAAVAGCGAVGVCFGTGDVHDEVPASLVDACREHGLPLLLAPPETPFSAISRYVAEVRLGPELASARATSALVPELLASLRRGDDARQMLDRAGAVLGGYFRLDPDDRAAEPQHSVVVPGAGTVVWVGPGPLPDPAVLDVIARFVSAVQGERDMEAMLQRERVGQLLSLVERRMLLPDALSQLLDWPGLAAPELAVSAWPAGAGVLLTQALPGALVADAPEVCLVLCQEPARVAAAAAELSLPSGHSAPVRLAELDAAIAQARIALNLARQHGGSVGPDRLSTLDSLLELVPSHQLSPFRRQLIDPLETLDRDRRTQYIRTLQVFLAHNGSVVGTARELYLHTNTVRHRLARIHELTGRNPLVFDDLVAFSIGLRAAGRAPDTAGHTESRTT